MQKYIVLTPTEQKIIACLQKNGSLNISSISINLGLARTSIYAAFKKLIARKLIENTGYTYTIPENKLGALKNMPAADSKAMINKLLDEITKLRKGDIVYSIESDEEIKELFKDKKELILWQKKIAQKKIVLKGIGSIKALRHFRANMDKTLSEEIKKRSGSSRFLHSELPGNCTLISFRESIAIISRSKNLFYRINNRHASLFIQNFIDQIYELLEYSKIIS